MCFSLLFGRAPFYPVAARTQARQPSNKVALCNNGGKATLKGGAMRSVIFDLDGTLADTSGDLIAAANVCFRDMGAGDMLDPAKDAGTALRGGRAMLKLGLGRMGRATDAAALDHYYPVLLEAYGAAIAVHTVLYPRAMEAVESLKTMGYRVGICTNKPEGLAETLLRELAVRDAFHAMLGADSLPVRKPDPEHLFETARRAGGAPDQCILIGDTATDRNTAKAAGVPSVLVTFGPAGGDMAALEPEALLSDYADLPALVEELIGRNP
jgi:phosphoglycolate phosphatase